MSETEYLSHSRAYVYNKCKKAFSLKYLDKVKPLSGTVYLDSWTRMQRGIIGHSAMEAGFLGENIDDYVRAKFKENADRFGGLSTEQEALAPGMISDSVAVAKAALEWLPVEQWEPYKLNGKPMVEAKLELPLPHWKGFIGYADLVARYKPTGAVYVLDYKFRASFEREDMDKYNSQFALYQKALNELSVPVVGSVLFELKPTPPARAPRTVREDTGNLNGVRVSADGRFRLTPTHRSREFIDSYWEDFKVQAKAIANMQPEDAYRSMSGFNCSTCEYERLCMGELRNDDVSAILARHYNVPREALRVLEDLT